MSLNTSLLQTNVDALEEGATLLTAISTEQYTQGYKPAFNSTIGAHFRHVLEHYRCFLNQLSSGKLCYDNRERDQLLESDCDYAKRTIEDLKQALVSLSDEALSKSCEVVDQQADGIVTSSVHRELLFLQSHTAHHYAIIAAMARALGSQPEANFGVAIATRTHQKGVTAQTSSNLNRGDTSCAQ